MRVDLALPAFTEPSTVDNPLFPVSKQASVLLLGRVDGQPSSAQPSVAVARSSHCQSAPANPRRAA